jgi:hypothetical protein
MQLPSAVKHVASRVAYVKAKRPSNSPLPIAVSQIMYSICARYRVKTHPSNTTNASSEANDHINTKDDVEYIDRSDFGG